jgi:hypothetical protein
MSAPNTIPFEKQSDPQSTRTCGAACLAMVYRSFGKEVSQAQIWPAIARQNRFGSIASTTHLMAQDALNRGFAAVAMQARHPLQVLRLCRDAGVRAVLNHRAGKESATGHYSVFVDLDDAYVTLHDPFAGPSRRVPHEEFLELWQPQLPHSEIMGHGLIAIADARLPAFPPCEFCHTLMPPAVACPRCENAVRLRPATPLGCVNNACIARMWNYVCCPSCDFTWSFTMQSGEATPEAASWIPPNKANDSEPPPERLSLTKMFAEMDKFLAQVLAIPGMAEHEEIKKQIAFIAANNEQIALARAEGLANFKAHQDNMAAVDQAARKNAEAHARRMDSLNKPGPVLDGDALGAALLKNLGFQ